MCIKKVSGLVLSTGQACHKLPPKSSIPSKFKKVHKEFANGQK
jgi:hypothetical protein